MTQDELYAALPESLKPFAAQYGPVVLGWAASDLQAWLQLLIKGDIYAAYAQVLKGLDNVAALDEWSKLDAEWKKANAENAARRTLAESAVIAILKVVLGIALAAAGL